MFNFIHYTDIFGYSTTQLFIMLFSSQFFVCITPRYFLVKVLSIRLLFTFTTKDPVLTCLFVINIYFVLEIISESLFVVSQSIPFVISRLTKFCNFPRLLFFELKLYRQRKV